MGKLRPWEENCHAANKYTQLRQNFPCPASSPVLFLLCHNMGEAVPRPGPSLVHSSGLALLQCTEHRPPGCEGPETTTQRKKDRGREGDAVGCPAVHHQDQGGGRGFSEPEMSHFQQANTAWSGLQVCSLLFLALPPRPI